MSFPSQKEFAAQLRAMQAGIDADLTNVDTVILGQVSYSVPDLHAKVDEFLAAQETLRHALNAYQTAVVAGRRSRAAAETFRGQLHAYVAGRHGKSHPMLARYGFSPEPPREVSAATKAVSALKGKATRKERGTASKKQKAKIKGQIDETILATLRGEDGADDNAPDAVKAAAEVLRIGKPTSGDKTR